MLGCRLSPPTRSEGETTTDCRSKVVVVFVGDAGAMRNGDGQAQPKAAGGATEGDSIVRLTLGYVAKSNLEVTT
jgi:hypothetical protein